MLADETRRQQLLPVSARKIFLSHAAVTVLPQPVADAMADYVRASAEDFIVPTYLRVLQEVRTTAAGLIQASPEEIALLGPTSLGLSLFANGIRWSPGDEVICYQDDYPANVYPWLNLRTRGVTVRFVQP
ncbi:MAG: aminotransferase class V-fold PLP-dependent enzyme, partial [Verrucomicrobia bacterium]|nr:aminotransferase class V-fold PLP-dependent enzyme [Verrucomicrobiota bacterium]